MKPLAELVIQMELKHPSSPNGFPSTVEADDINLHSYAGYLVSIPYISKTGEALWTTRLVSS